MPQGCNKIIFVDNLYGKNNINIKQFSKKNNYLFHLWSSWRLTGVAEPPETLFFHLIIFCYTQFQPVTQWWLGKCAAHAAQSMLGVPTLRQTASEATSGSLQQYIQDNVKMTREDGWANPKDLNFNALLLFIHLM